MKIIREIYIKDKIAHIDLHKKATSLKGRVESYFNADSSNISARRMANEAALARVCNNVNTEMKRNLNALEAHMTQYVYEAIKKELE